MAVIAPWNFPLAIACGMTAGALATGNAVVLKPAEQSPGCAEKLVQALLAGGVPAGVISLVPGEGEVGAALVRHRDVNAIDLTGTDTGARAALQQAAADNVKRVYIPAPRGTADWNAEPGISRLTAFVETKTVWHPVGI